MRLVAIRRGSRLSAVHEVCARLHRVIRDSQYLHAGYHDGASARAAVSGRPEIFLRDHGVGQVEGAREAIEDFIDLGLGDD